MSASTLPGPAPGMLREPPGPGRIEVGVTAAPLPTHNPLDLYTALLRGRSQDDVFLLEGAGGPQQDNRTDYVGFDRLAEIRVRADRFEVEGAPALVAAVLVAADRLRLAPLPGGGRALAEPGQLWELLTAVQDGFALDSDLPENGYAFGFLAALGYGAAWHTEVLPPRDPADAGVDCTFSLFRHAVRYDRRTGEVLHLTARSAAFPAEQGAGRLGRAVAEALNAPEQPVPGAPAAEVRDSMTESTFLGLVRRCLEHIRVGDVYQIQIGHRLDVRTGLTPLEVYRRLRQRNPSPHMYLVPSAGRLLIGSSPELLLRIDGDRIEMRPIAGTARRTGCAREDARRVAVLRTSQKEQAEHVMLVDLCRNDIGRVSRAGTLDATGLMTVETFSHVYHLVSTVTGRLAAGANPWTALCAGFPAGTVTGAPKVRAMELIAGLESEPRGAYAGAVGLVDLRGWSRLALCIRTVVHEGGDRYSTQSSAGIVADSSPEAEWRETLAKMGAAHWALTGEELLP